MTLKSDIENIEYDLASCEKRKQKLLKQKARLESVSKLPFSNIERVYGGGFTTTDDVWNYVSNTQITRDTYTSNVFISFGLNTKITNGTKMFVKNNISKYFKQTIFRNYHFFINTIER